MSRCQRCDACESMWDTSNCKYCNYPDKDTRTPQQILIDDADYRKRVGEDEYDR